jgi:sulfite exporter TauE/SafE
MTTSIAAILLGLAGSLHCVGMCGPIALALPIQNSGRLKRIVGAFAYNIGRALMYAALGIIIGLFGQGLQLIGLQQIVSVILGLSILLYYLVPDFFSGSKFNLFYSKLVYRLKNKFIPFMKKRTISSLLIVGMINGLLPCGLVYAALVAALALGEIQSAASFMFFFGLATLPMMLGIILLKDWISIRLQSSINKFLPTLMIVMAVLLVFRGMNLGIPYVSPKINRTGNTICHDQKEDTLKAHACVIPARR